MGFHWVWFQPKEAWKYMTALLNVQVRCLPSTISSSVALCLRFLKKISNFSAHYLTNSRLPSPTNVGQWCPRQTPSLWDFSSHHELWTIHQICYQPWSFSGLRLCFRVHIANSWLLEGWLCVLHSKARWAWSDWDQVHHLDHLDLHGLLGIFRQLPAWLVELYQLGRMMNLAYLHHLPEVQPTDWNRLWVDFHLVFW